MNILGSVLSFIIGIIVGGMIVCLVIGGKHND